jgi:tyrosyl-tRNA synthetase
MGGSDQWGNITSGTEFIRRNVEGGKAYAITSPLLTKSDGKKFGKSEEGNIWLDPNLTSPYKFYQFWLRTPDEDIVKFFKYFSLESRNEMIEKIENAKSNPNELKKSLAEELTIRIHSQEDFDSVEKVSELLFNKNANKDTLHNMTNEAFRMIAQEIPRFEISMREFEDGLNIVDLLADKTSILSSKSDARRALQNNAIAVNKEKIQNHEALIHQDQLLHERYLMIENGRKNKILVEAIQ